MISFLSFNIPIHLIKKATQAFFLLTFFNCALVTTVFAQQQVVGKLIAGEEGYAVSVEVKNWKDKPIENLSIKILNQPQALVNLKIMPQTLDSLGAGEIATYTVSFDVAEDAKSIDYAEIKISISADDTEFDIPEPVVAVAVVAKKNAALTFYLVNTKTIKKLKKPANYPCVYNEQDLGGRCTFEYRGQGNRNGDYLYSMGFTEVPLKIVLGEPFKLKGKVAILSSFSKEHECHPDKINTRSITDKWWCLTNGQTFRSPAGELTYVASEPHNSGYGYNINVPGVTDFVIRYEPKECKINYDIFDYVLCDSEQGKKILQSGHYLNKKYTYNVTINLEGSDSRSYRTKDFIVSRDIIKFLNNDGFLDLPENFTEEEITEIREEIKRRSKHFELEILNLNTSLQYQTVIKGERYLTSVQAFNFSDEVNSETATPTNLTQTQSPSGQNSNVVGVEGATRVIPGIDLDKPTSINPNHPNVTALINQWISTAEPVVNAKGAKLHFDQWGRMVGQTIGGIITLNGNPDDASGQTSQQYVWGRRDQLDSLEHCTLGKFVQLSLRGDSLKSCRRDRLSETDGLISLPDLMGSNYRDAVVTLKAAGLVVLSPELGSHARSPNDAGKVEKIRQLKEGVLRKGDKVIPQLYAKAVKSVSVPDVVGLTIKKAAKIMKYAGFKVGFEIGLETRDPTKDKTISKQTPEAKLDVKSGSKVTLFLYRLKQSTSTLPDLTGLSIGKAKELLQSLGLVLKPELGMPALSSGSVGRIYNQSMEAGLALKKGSTVKVLLHGKQSRKLKQNPEQKVVTRNPPVNSLQPGKPNWDNGCNDKNKGGATILWKLRDPPPYSGLTPICSDRDGVKWILGNRILRIVKGNSASNGCYPNAVIFAKNRPYKGKLCPVNSG